MRLKHKEAGRFYLLPKTHKVPVEEIFTAEIPGMPIVSNNNTPTESPSKFLNHHLSSTPTTLPSFVQDTPHFLRINNSINANQILSNRAILVTLDVCAVYTNIPTREGIEAVSKSLAVNPQVHVPEVYLSLLELVLMLNYFEFDSIHYLQTFGTSMGTPFAPTYANIFMGQLEANLIKPYPLKPHTYLHYIDDIIIIREHGTNALTELISLFNRFHLSIKFTAHHSPSQINFLDTTVYIENGKLRTTLYQKPTDSQQYLDYTSHHPQHCKRGIFVGQAKGIRRISSEDSNYIHHLNDLKVTLAERNHPQIPLDQA